MAAQLRVIAIGAHHHRERVPAHDGEHALFDLGVAGVLRLLGERNRVRVWRVEHRRQRHPARTGALEELAQQEGRALAPLRIDNGVECLDPFAGLDGVGILLEHAPETVGGEIGKVGHGGLMKLCRTGGRTNAATPAATAGNLLKVSRNAIAAGAARVTCGLPPHVTGGRLLTGAECWTRVEGFLLADAHFDSGPRVVLRTAACIEVLHQSPCSTCIERQHVAMEKGRATS